jgi:hypothetical protein
MPTYLRGFLPSLGAGGSLVGASLVVAAILSSIIAFQGWPGGTSGADGGSVTLRGPRPAPPVQRTRVAPAERATGAATPATARRRGSTRRTAVSGPTARRRGSTPAVPRSGVSAPAPSTTSPAPAPASAPSSPAKAKPSAPAPSSGGGTTPAPSQPPVTAPLPDRAVTTVVDTVQQAVPPVPPAVQPVVDAVNQVVDGAAATVDDTVGGLLGG